MTRARGRFEKAGVAGIALEEAHGKFRADLVARRTDRRAEHRDDVAAPCAQRLHRVKRRLQHAAEGALPACVGGADHSGVGVGEEDHPAIGAGDADRQARRGSGERVHTGPFRPCLGYGQAGRRMNLIGHEQRRRAEMVGHAAAVLGNRLGVVARADAPVEAGVDAGGDAALSREEGVAERSQRWCGSYREGVVGHAGSSKPGGGTAPGATTAIALNSVAMLDSCAVKRASAASTAAACSGVP